LNHGSKIQDARYRIVNYCNIENLKLRKQKLNNTCPKCNNKLEENDVYCFECGKIFLMNIQCLNHLTTAAQGICVICGKPVCKKCVTEIQGRFLCEEDNDYEIVENYAKIFDTDDPGELEFIKNRLKKAEIEFIILNKDYNSPTIPINLDEMDIGKINIYVPIKLVRKAEKIITGTEDQPSFKYECVNCGVRFNTDEKRCPSCGTDFINEMGEGFGPQVTLR
jgi:DNA-directed RNA polymerase subunit RPC12/RpoP